MAGQVVFWEASEDTSPQDIQQGELVVLSLELVVVLQLNHLQVSHHGTSHPA